MAASPTVREMIGFRPQHIDVPVGGIHTLDGGTLTVRCVRPDREEMVVLMGRLSGERPAAAPDDSADGRQASLARLAELAPDLISRWASVQDGDGVWRCPAFTSVESEENAHLIPCSELSYLDLASLSAAIMRLGGYLGGAASASFSPK